MDDPKNSPNGTPQIQFQTTTPTITNHNNNVNWTQSFPFKIILFASLVSVQIFVAIIYKLSQSTSTQNTKYNYSPASALVIAELFKFLMSFGFLLLEKKGEFKNCVILFFNSFRSNSIQIGSLSLLYAFNNQLTFYLFLWADPASLTIFKSASSFLSAMLLWMSFNREILALQWKVILIQVLGLCIVQWDPCENLPLLSIGGYSLLFASVLTTTVSGVFNEYTVKTLPDSINIVNMILYLFGIAFNFICFLFLSPPGSNDSRVGFFEGYDAAAIGVIIANSLMGIVITLVYKYADVIVKTFATAFTTCALFFINHWFFGKESNVMSYLGSFVVFLAVYIFFTDAKSPNNSGPLVFKFNKKRTAFVLIGFSICLVFLSLVFIQENDINPTSIQHSTPHQNHNNSTNAP